MVIEREHLLPLATEGVDLAQTSFPDGEWSGLCEGADQLLLGALAGGHAGASQGLRQHRSSCGTRADCVARHERCYRRQQQILDLEHYLDVLYRKPGALAGSKPLEQKRQAGLWPASFDRIWEALMERHGKQSGTRQMIDLLKLGAEAWAAASCRRRSNRLWRAVVTMPRRFSTC